MTSVPNRAPSASAKPSTREAPPLTSGSGSGTAMNVVTSLELDTPGCDAGIYRVTTIPSLHPSDLALVVDHRDWHEIQARALVPYAAIHGMERPPSGVWAVRAAPVLAANLHRQLRGQPLRLWHPQRRALQLLGDGGALSGRPQAIALWGPLALGPSPALWRWNCPPRPAAR